HWIDVLIGKVNQDIHADVRAHAISALGRYVYEGEIAMDEGWDAPDVSIHADDYARVTDFLFRIAQDPEEALETRRYAIEALAFRSDDADVIELIEWAYRHPDRRLKVSAIFSMARNGDPRFTDAILRELYSDDSELQHEAIHAAGELALPEAAAALIELIHDQTIRKSMRLLAIYSLGQTGAERAYTELDQLARAKDRDVRQVAQDALEEWYLVNEEQRELDGDGLDEEFALEALPDIWNDELGTFSRN
ncbi:MAG: HEAT repeat domain-containing protein, partial [Chloroflexi bacterium]|nr:HEAT repeat domain-containing protein [Chloroflexota bacterium]